ncbi:MULTISPECIES: hypothetical protein [Mesorhizobium]|uniref:hypothetical protein n=1 Tax=Mesorhizobium TaxID=68287 RepID=UPI0003CE0890|nr:MULTISPECIES: hypothetical protein [Mesorhizobium]ESY70034.1 hypothetical protein X742_06925 [Mesorhizobium sp. LNHC232B00]WJI39554.1 hypothetical protein NL534_04625 [Mesorhizobium opportunistum]
MNLKMVPEHPNRIARIGSVLALVGSLVWVQWPINFSSFNIAAVILLIAAFITWISTELADYRESERFNDNVMSDDVDKLNSIIKIIDRRQFYTLKQKAIQTYMDEDDYRGLQSLIYYRENDIFHFHSVKIQTIYEKFSKEVLEFYMRFYSLYTYDGHGRSTWRPSGDRYVSDEVYKEIQHEIAMLDHKASKLVELWEELINVSRRELKGASKAIERYEL